MGQPFHPTAVTDANDQNTVAGRVIDWEYEYDSTETEDFYFTLDLTTHVPDALGVQSTVGRRNRKFTPGQDRKAQGHPSRAQGEEFGEDDDPDDSQFSSVETLQILDLHTEKPFVKYNDNVYNCYWSTDLGTQFHITRAGDVSKPYHAGTVLDVIGISQTRLLGKPAEIRPRKERVRLASVGVVSSTGPSVDDEDAGNDFVADDDLDSATQWNLEPGTPLRIPRDECKSSKARIQASFLERLSAIKLKKGELDQVPPLPIRVYDLPPNTDEIRQKDEKSRLARGIPESQHRDRRKRQRLTYAEKGINSSNSTVTSGRQSRDSVIARLGVQDSSNRLSLATTATDGVQTQGSFGTGASNQNPPASTAPTEVASTSTMALVPESESELQSALTSTLMPTLVLQSSSQSTDMDTTAEHTASQTIQNFEVHAHQAASVTSAMGKGNDHHQG